MPPVAEFFLALGGILLLGLVTSELGRRTFLPRVTLLLLFGVIIGEQVLDVVPPVFLRHFEIIADMALLMVGFLLGGKLELGYLRRCAGQVLWISVSAALGTTLVVALGLAWAGVPRDVAILLGCIAAATAPAAVLDVVAESGGPTPFRDLLLSIVAIDDVWALLLFAIGTALVLSLNGGGADVSSLQAVAWEIGGAVGLGIVLGLPAAHLTGRVRPGQPIVTEALGLVFFCGGLAFWLEVSFLIASIAMGAVVVNRARHHDYPFHAIEGIETPFMVLFFVLAGASLDLGMLLHIGWIGLFYIVLRSIGKLAGAGCGAVASGADPVTRRWMGMALLPQAGVAIGMALVASNRFPEHQQILLSIVISTTVVFEIIGPVLTRFALRRALTARAVEISPEDPAA